MNENTTTHPTSEVIDMTEAGIKFFVSGSAETVDSTISLGWCIHKSILEQLKEKGEGNPLLLISVTSISQRGCEEEVTRKLVPLGQAIEFIQFRRPGEHEIMGTVVYKYHRSCEGSTLSAREHFLGTYSYRVGNFKNRVITHRCKDNEDRRYFDFRYYNGYQIGMGRLSVQVDKEFFAKEPPAWLNWWGNLWYRYKPIDQCDFRKRLIHAFTWKPFAFAVWFIVKELSVLLAAALLLLAGCRGISLKPCRHPLNYKAEWLWGDVNFIFFNLDRPYLAPLCPMIYLVFFLLFYLTLGNKGVGLSALYSLVICGGIALAILVAAIMLIKMGVSDDFILHPITTIKTSAKKQKKLEREMALTAIYDDITSTVCCSQSDRDFAHPTLQNLPPKKKTLHLRFWNLKAKVCKPFADKS
ncbi:MAG: hypothetical protein WC548_01700 [Candidatus Pacearchaeota archaeon]